MVDLMQKQISVEEFQDNVQELADTVKDDDVDSEVHPQSDR